MEIWKAVKGYEGFYEVSTEGRVRSLDRYVKNSRNGKLTVFKRGIIKKQTLDDEGYLIVTLNRDGEFCNKLVHRLVAEAFLDKHDVKDQVNHKDENKQNNNVNNLEWCTIQYNVNYGTRTARAMRKRYKPVLMYSKDGELLRYFHNLSSVRELGYNPSNIKYTCDGDFLSMYGYVWRWA